MSKKNKKNSGPKNQHFVPKCYLSEFTDPPSRIAVLTWSKASSQRMHPDRDGSTEPYINDFWFEFKTGHQIGRNGVLRPPETDLTASLLGFSRPPPGSR